MLDIWLEREDMSSVLYEIWCRECCIWCSLYKEYMQEVYGEAHTCWEWLGWWIGLSLGDGTMLSHFGRRGCGRYQNFKFFKISWSYGCGEWDDKASGGFGTRWRTDQIKTLSKKAIFLMIGERVFWCQCTRRNVIYLCAVHTELLVYWSRWWKYWSSRWRCLREDKMSNVNCCYS